MDDLVNMNCVVSLLTLPLVHTNKDYAEEWNEVNIRILILYTGSTQMQIYIVQRNPSIKDT